MRLPALSALAATLMLVLCACAANSGATPTPGAAGAPGSSASPSPLPSSRGPAPRESPASEGQAAAAVDAARRDAAQRLNTSPESLRVEDVESRQWPDRSLGCPRQGVLYAQVLTPGYLIVLSSGSRRLEYHTDDRGMAVFCQEQS
jgi:hypothetical protein